MLVPLFTTQAQSLSYPLGAAAVAAGNTSISRKDLWAAFNNQAAVAFLKQPEAGIFVENRFMVTQLNRIAVAAAVPMKRITLSITTDQIGADSYAEIKAGTGCAIRFGDHFSAGIQLNYHHLNIGDAYDAHHAFTFEGGIFAELNKMLSMGIHIFNPLQTKWDHAEEKITATIRGGLAFAPEPSLSLYAEVEKSTLTTAFLCAGAEYRFREKFFFRAGFSSGTSRYSFGAGFKLQKLIIDFASTVHSWLGYSPQLSITYSFKQYK